MKIVFSFRKPQLLFFGKGVRLFYTRNIIFGKWVQLEEYVFVSALGKELISFGNNAKIGAYSRIITATSFNNIGEYIKIGNNVGIGEFAYLGGGSGLEIGDDCIIGQYFSCPVRHRVAFVAKWVANVACGRWLLTILLTSCFSYSHRRMCA